MSFVSDQVAPAHHNHNQSYRPSYSDKTWRMRKKKEGSPPQEILNTPQLCKMTRIGHLAINELVHLTYLFIVTKWKDDP